MRTAIVIILVVAALSGCSEQEPSGATVSDAQVQVSFLPDTGREVLLDFAGAWLHGAGPNGTWVRILDNGTSLGLPGDGLPAQAPEGRYDLARVVFNEVHVDGASLPMVATGFDLPIALQLQDNGTTELIFGIAWQDAVFDAKEGRVFEPVLRSFEAKRGDEQLLHLAAEEIQTTPTKPPVARIEAFDSLGLRFFQSDFIAESPDAAVIAAGPNLTFQASPSEAVEQGATLSEYRWDFGDGTQGQGNSVEHTYPLSGGNFTVRLTVVDSNGVQDAITLPLVIQPGLLSDEQRASGTVTGVYPSGCPTSANGQGLATQKFTVAAGETPDGTPADLVKIKVRLYALGNPHAGADMALRVLDPAGGSVGTSSDDGTSESVSASYARGAAPDGDWTVEIRPCAAVQQDYEVAFEATWVGKADPGFLAFLAGYDDGHEHSH